jgi:hypothetical protein
LLGPFFGDVLVSRQSFAPETVQLSAKRLQALRAGLVDPASAVDPVDHQPDIFQYLEMLGDCRATDGKLCSELADRAGPVNDALEDRASGRVPERGPHVRVVIHGLR